jgi:hypothetical protein
MAVVTYVSSSSRSSTRCLQFQDARLFIGNGSEKFANSDHHPCRIHSSRSRDDKVSGCAVHSLAQKTSASRRS